MATAEAYRVVSTLPAGTAFSRYLMCLAAARGDRYKELRLAEQFTSTPHVLATLGIRNAFEIAQPDPWKPMSRITPSSIFR